MHSLHVRERGPLVLNRGGGVPGVAAIRRFDLAELEVAVAAQWATADLHRP